ncbi:MFS transporter [Coraliomargarita akajimensis]|uniref:Phospholipid/glycerol acyltransferase n=1 Tax=Coraliomargarita akajimensis (strain DSM 45221 / IAM 15411 / JCM 23193 / KCTC 12865 / 04OKA010-24) TaxID=583355 RepID=D5EI14_CORAD|nr:MFS transporter [Coraliomargarita akajimensis]ADE56054.1 phospholipid/glycerol acyltransferase [Coraliomargarita akajimensis DSM 45221]
MPLSKDKLPRSFWWHMATSFGGAMNDNLFKLFMVYALICWKGAEHSASILAMVGVVFSVPFILIAPIAGNFADKFSKRNMIVFLKAVEIGVMAFGILALSLKSEAMLYATMFLMSAQSAFFGPCKFGIIPEQSGPERLSRANGYLQMFTFLAIIAGTVLAPELSLLLDGRHSVAASISLVIAILGFTASLQIAPTRAHPQRTINLNGFQNIWRTLRFTRTDPPLLLALLAVSFFTLVAAYIQLNVLDFGHQHLDLSHEQATRLFLLTAIGIGAGSTLAGWLSGRSIEFGFVPLAASLITLCLIGLGLIAHGQIALAAINMFLLGVAAGLFVVPLEAFIQQRSPEDRRGAVQAANAFLSWLGIFTASGLLYFNASILKLSAQHGFLVIAFGMLVLSVFTIWVLSRYMLRLLLVLLIRIFYRLRISGIEQIPPDSPALLVSNHVSLMDALVILSSYQRHIRMLMSRDFYEKSDKFTQWMVRYGKVILIQDSDNPKKLIQSLKEARKVLNEGHLVCIFAEGGLSEDGTLQPLKPGFERIVKNSDIPIIPLYLNGLWQSVASHKNGEPQINPLKDLRIPISLSYGPALAATSSADEVHAAIARLAKLDDSSSANA